MNENQHRAAASPTASPAASDIAQRDAENRGLKIFAAVIVIVVIASTIYFGRLVSKDLRVTEPAAHPPVASAPAAATASAAAPAASSGASGPADAVVASASSSASAAAASAPAAAAPAAVATAFAPPAADKIPEGPMGDMIRKGEQIFLHTGANAKAFVGNSLNCVNCHLDAGRQPHSAPLWGAYTQYPTYRSKTKSVDTFSERLRGCFMYSMNGKAPPDGHEVLVALESYAYWMAKGSPVGEKLPGGGYPKLAKPAQSPDYERGAKVFEAKCALCHGADGQGQRSGEVQNFPPLWGPKSYNWGAGMGEIDKAAGFIKANMPLGLGNSLSDQEAWDVATYIDSQERPQDPRFTGNVAETRKQFHDTPMSMYGMEVKGRVLGQGK